MTSVSFAVLLVLFCNCFVQLSVNKYHCHCQECPWDANASVVLSIGEACWVEDAALTHSSVTVLRCHVFSRISILFKHPAPILCTCCNSVIQESDGGMWNLNVHHIWFFSNYLFQSSKAIAAGSQGRVCAASGRKPGCCAIKLAGMLSTGSTRVTNSMASSPAILMQS